MKRAGRNRLTVTLCLMGEFVDDEPGRQAPQWLWIMLSFGYGRCSFPVVSKVMNYQKALGFNALRCQKALRSLPRRFAEQESSPLFQLFLDR
jgi:hypothetical protein